jgi:guanine deaminase
MEKISLINYANDLAKLSIANKGGPFGCVITDKNNNIIGIGNNTVTKKNDPTAHAEINAIRNTCKNLETFNLQDCILYSSCEPCPMCLSAIYWANITKVYYSNTREDAANIGFNDEFIYNELDKPKEERSVKLEQLKTDNSNFAFEIWKNKTDKINY